MKDARSLWLINSIFEYDVLLDLYTKESDGQWKLVHYLYREKPRKIIHE